MAVAIKHSLAPGAMMLFCLLSACALLGGVSGIPWRGDNVIADPARACEEIASRSARTFADGNNVEVKASPASVDWGFFWKHSKPYRVINSGDEVYMETVTHHGADAYDEIVEGDQALMDIYRWTEDEMTLSVRGATGSSDGAHIMTGPLWVCGAQKGDVLEIEILEAEPRVNPSSNKAFSVNAATWWGFHRRTDDGADGVQGGNGYVTGDKPRETVTVYETLLDEKDAQGNYYVTPKYTYQWWTDPGATGEGDDSRATPNGGDFDIDLNNGDSYLNYGDWNQMAGQRMVHYNGAARTYCVPEIVELAGRDDMTYIVNKTVRTFGKGKEYPCEGGFHYWNEMGYRGMIQVHDGDERQPRRHEYSLGEMWGGSERPGENQGFKMPAKIHPGNIGVAQDTDNPTNSIPPGIWGGNFDNRRLNAGSKLFVPVQVAGALFSVGDSHMTQGDGEIDGTATEASINYKFKFTLHKSGSLPDLVDDLKAPLIETPQAFILQGAGIMNYIDFDFVGNNSVFTAGRGGGGDLNRALSETYKATRDWMMKNYKWTEDLTLSAITLGVDFGISQVVNGAWSLHSVIPKKFFPLAGRPEGPRDRTGEMPKKSGMTNIASMVVNEPNPVLTDDDLAEGESNNAYRMFVDGLQSTLTSLLCDGKQCGRTAEVIGVTRPDSSRRSLQSNHDSLMVVVVVTGIDADGLASAISGAAAADPELGWADAAALDAVSLTQSIRRNGLDNAAGSGAPQALLMLALLCTVFLALA